MNKKMILKSGALLALALLLAALAVVSLPVPSVYAGACLLPEQYNSDEYYAYPRGVLPELDKVCDKHNPGTMPGYRIHDYNNEVACESGNGIVKVTIAKCKLMRLRALGQASDTVR